MSSFWYDHFKRQAGMLPTASADLGKADKKNY